MIPASHFGGLNHVAPANFDAAKCAHRHVRFRTKRKASARSEHCRLWPWLCENAVGVKSGRTDFLEASLVARLATSIDYDRGLNRILFCLRPRQKRFHTAKTRSS